MTDLTPAPVATVTDADAEPGSSTAAGRLRILWSATADPQLAMSDSEVADVATVLDEHAVMARELGRLLNEHAAMAAELERLVEEKAAAFVDRTTMLRGMEVRDGIIEMSIEPARELLLTWCASVRAVLDDCQAENYAEADIEVPRPGSVSMDIQDSRNLTDSYTLTLQRRAGRTPHELRREAERDRDVFRAELEWVGGMTPAELLAWRAER